MPSSRAAFLISDVGRRVEDHLTDAVGQIEQLADRRAALEPGAAALDAAAPFVEDGRCARSAGSSADSIEHARA